MISVAMTTYNGERYIIQQLESIYKQSMPVDEVIICDDGSKDNTVNLVNDFIRDRALESWRMIQNEKNLRYSKNFFKAISMCAGDYIFFADQDDIWYKDKVKLMIKKMEESPDILALSTGYTIIDKRGKEKKHVLLASQNRLLTIKETGANSLIKGCTMCIRKELDRMLEHSDLNFELQLGHDWYYNFLAVLSGKNVLLAQPLLYYRVHGENISLKRNSRTMALATTKINRIAIFNEIINSMEIVTKRYEKIAEKDEEKQKDLKLLIKFNKCRKNFIEGRYVKIFSLMKMIKCYRDISFSCKDALHSFLSDVMYAFNINWRIKQ